jgi:hypothetical protein
MMSWRRNRRRREALAEPFPEAWRTRLAYRWPVWNTLDAQEREHRGMQVVDVHHVLNRPVAQLVGGAPGDARLDAAAVCVTAVLTMASAPRRLISRMPSRY